MKGVLGYLQLCCTLKIAHVFDPTRGRWGLRLRRGRRRRRRRWRRRRWWRPPSAAKCFMALGTVTALNGKSDVIRWARGLADVVGLRMCLLFEPVTHGEFVRCLFAAIAFGACTDISRAIIRVGVNRYQSRRSVRPQTQHSRRGQIRGIHRCMEHEWGFSTFLTLNRSELRRATCIDRMPPMRDLLCSRRSGASRSIPCGECQLPLRLGRTRVGMHRSLCVLSTYT